jgi:hypothetical protein
MKYRNIIIPLVFLLPLPVQETRTETETFLLGKTEINIQRTKYGEDGERSLFLNLHENESTSVTAAVEYLENKDAHFVSIKHDGNRNISFVLKDVTWQFDPNRMFTRQGRIANLKLLNKKYSDKAEEAIEEFSDKIIKRVKHAKIVIALHNNTNGRPLSVNSYRKKYVNPKMDTDDFVLTTDESIFNTLKAKKINTVWETTATSKDDGSLAYYCSGKHIPYINVEAQAGHFSEQLRMLNTLTDIINEYAHR